MSVEKENGIWTFAPDWEALALEENVPDGDVRQFWIYNTTTQVYTRIPLSALIEYFQQSVPNLYGGAETNSSLSLYSTSNESPSGDYVRIIVGGAETVRFPNGGGVLLGATSAPATGGLTAKSFITASGAGASLSVLRQSGGGGGGALIALGSSEGTIASPSVTTSGKGLGSFIFYGDDGTGLTHQSASIIAVAAANFSGTSTPSYIEFGTTPVGSTANPTARFRIGSEGNLVFGNAAGGAKATNATNGWPMMPTSAGAPTGTPATSYTGFVPFQYDTTNNKLWVYNGAWKGVALT